jgi:hypothetical protein
MEQPKVEEENGSEWKEGCLTLVCRGDGIQAAAREAHIGSSRVPLQIQSFDFLLDLIDCGGWILAVVRSSNLT